MIFYATDEAEYHTTLPPKTLNNSGWQLQGNWRGLVGTPIASNLFISAQHVGGTVGETFSLQGIGYTTVESFPDPDSDLIVWRVCGTFPAFALPYPRQDEAGRNLVWFGRGLGRGNPVYGPGGTNAAPVGWLWGQAPGVLRWGEAKVTGSSPEGPNGSSLLEVDFDPQTSPDAVCLAGGDSAGGLFIQDGTQWKLAGVNYSVSGPFNTTNSGPGFDAALFDARGFYTGGENQWELIPQSPSPQPSTSYATRISARQAWLQGILQAHGPASPPLLESAGDINGPFSTLAGAVVDENGRTVQVPVTAAQSFFRLQYCRALSLYGWTVQGGVLTLRYE